MARKPDRRRKSALEQKRIRMAKKHFGITPGCGIFLKHIDETLSYTDPNRYHEWRIEDLTTMSKKEWYANYHNNSNWRKRISDNCKPYKWYSKGSTTEKLKSASFPWKRARTNTDTVSSNHSFVARRVKCIETKELFDSIAKAAISVGVSSAGVSDCLHGKQKTAGGFHWEFAK